MRTSSFSAAGAVLVLLCAVGLGGCNWLQELGLGQAAKPAPGEGEPAVAEVQPAPVSLDQGHDSGAAYTAHRNPYRDNPDPYRVLGRELGEWEVGEWENTSIPLKFSGLRGKVVVVRFWTDKSEDCARSLVALQNLANKYRGRPVQFVGIYHSTRSWEEPNWLDVCDEAERLRVRFPIAYDHQWRTLDRWWLDRLDNVPTNVTFVFGPDGRVIHVHPGPLLCPSSDPLEKLCDDDFRSLGDAINNALSQQLAESRVER
ncbi:MAG: TlpA family protein disulfide reductase [Planctomycetales bacterium]|nr:TlpA family protein disulfide reductase [Planctomycetales bacterium]